MIWLTEPDSLSDPTNLPLPPPPPPSAPPAPPSAPPAPSSAPAPSLGQAAFDRAQIADGPRLPWAWSLTGKDRQDYTPQVGGKWWSDLPAADPARRRDVGHIGRIMETELGVKLEGEARCEACRRRN